MYEASDKLEGRAVMAQYAVLIYTHDSAHAPDATPEDTESCDRHSDELAHPA